MNVEETITGTATSASSVAATITAAAETLLVAFVGWKEPSTRLVSISGWTEENQINLPAGHGFALFWKYNATAGDVTATAEFTDQYELGPETVGEAFLYLSEISGADKIDHTQERSDDDDASITTVNVVSREGNIALHYAVVAAGSLSEVTQPTGHSIIADDDGTGWCMFGYWKAAPYSSAYIVTTLLSTGRNFSAVGAECDLTITQTALLGSDF